jgi:hypothetical protein
MKAGRSSIAATLALLTQAAVAADAAWITDANGCKVWDEKPTPNETVTWSGACLDGYASGEGVLQWIVNGKLGSRQEGRFAGGKANGKGTHYVQGMVVEGDFVDGALLGHVVMTWPGGDRYEGDSVAGGRTGKGVLTRANGDRYDGDFVNGKWSGHGTFTNANGARYEGGWLDNKRSGHGVLLYANGDRYEGDFVDGNSSGHGTYTSVDGARYEGSWLDSKRNGQGDQVYADGAAYSGEWRDDNPTNPDAIKRKKYALNTDVTGSYIAEHHISNLQVPANKTYAQLTREERQVVKESYEKMAKDDEPPYPLHGVMGILRASETFQRKFLVRGELDLAVTVDSHGTATSVEVYKSPDAQLTKAMASVLMLEKYKPAVCNGSPCQMKFPFKAMYHVTL